MGSLELGKDGADPNLRVTLRTSMNQDHNDPPEQKRAVAEPARQGEAHLPKQEILRKTLAETTDLESAQTFLLLDLYQKGDREAGDALARRYEGRLQRYVRVQRGQRLRHALLTEDVVQAAYLELLEMLAKFEYRGKDSLYAYLKQIAYNKLRTGIREAGAHVPVDDDAAQVILAEQVGREPAPDAASDERELEEILDQAMMQLPDKHRDVISKRRLLEGTWKDIAEDMGYSDHRAVEVMYFRAKVDWLAIAEPRLKAWRTR